MEQQEASIFLNDRIKKMLRKFTDDFSNEDIDFIKLLIYPIKITIVNTDLDDEDPNKKITTEAECLSDIESAFKKLPENCEVTIPSITGKMRLISRL